MAKLALVQQQTIIGLNQLAIEEWQEYRTEKKKPLSQLALKKTTNLMLKYPEIQQQVMVDAAIMNDWQGLHPVEAPKNENRLGSNTGAHQPKLTPAQRTAAKREQLRGSRSSDMGVVATHEPNLRPSVGQPAE